MEYGILTLLPVLVVVALALITKRTLEPLIDSVTWCLQ